ncbi:hypothetical protein RA2_03076 [Roseovarius sp. A-2]|nr:hypothetical protein RA2_03076 [Roseovarius sp. A-2]
MVLRSRSMCALLAARYASASSFVNAKSFPLLSLSILTRHWGQTSLSPKSSKIAFIVAALKLQKRTYFRFFVPDQIRKRPLVPQQRKLTSSAVYQFAEDAAKVGLRSFDPRPLNPLRAESHPPRVSSARRPERRYPRDSRHCPYLPPGGTAGQRLPARFAAGEPPVRRQALPSCLGLTGSAHLPTSQFAPRSGGRSVARRGRQNRECQNHAGRFALSAAR